MNNLLNLIKGSVSRAEDFAKKGTKILSSFDKAVNSLNELNEEIAVEQLKNEERVVQLEAAMISNDSLMKRNKTVVQNIEKLLGITPNEEE